MKYKLKLFMQMSVFVLMYGMMVLIVTMSKIPQTVYGFTEVIQQTLILDPKTYIMLLVVNLALFAGWLKVSK